MKIKSVFTLGFIIVHFALCLSARAQGSSLNSFTYQGRLNDTNGAANGLYDFSFALFPAGTGGSQIGTTVSRGLVPVTNGLFTVPLEFLDANSFPGADRWLEIAVHPSGVGTNITLSPRQQITAAPYAIRAANLSGPLPLSQLPAGVVTNNGSGVTLAGTFTGNGTGLSNVNAATLGGVSSAGFWKTNGNAGANPTNGAFLGTTDNLPVEFRVNGVRALRLEPTPNGAPNVIGGSLSNSVAASVEGATIAGGGLALFPNKITSSYATIGGGRDNRVAGGHSTVSGGNLNLIQTNADFATIGGGSGNTIQTNSSFATIGGGWFNRAAVNEATVAGGAFNNALGFSATVGGGGGNAASGEWSTIAGGRDNLLTNADYAIIGGGLQNKIQLNAFAATIGGGSGNAASGPWSTIAGGRDNVVTNADYAAIGGGLQNIIQTNSAFSTIGGGGVNVVRSNAYRGTVGGGFVNTVGAPEGTVAGGAFNSALGFSATIGGGGGNAASGDWSIIAGGRDNQLLNAPYSTISGGLQNKIQPNAFAATIGGGSGNAASGAWSTIAGGQDNLLTNANYATIGGGVQNTIQTNAEFATIGGGAGNMIQSNAHFATIPGGRYNSATNYAFAAGNRAKANHAGAFVWADTTDSDFTSTAPNQFVIRASGGVGINNNNPNGAALAVNGDVNVEGIVSVNALSAASATTPQLNTPRIATSGNVPLELFVNGQRGLRLEPTAYADIVNVIGGSARNSVGAGLLGSTIAGGGGTFEPNTITASYATIGGGTFNTAGGFSATIGGGTFNTIKPSANYATISGGVNNSIGTNSGHSMIGGGEGNSIADNSSYSSIVGGFNNASAALSAVGGGYQNTNHASFSVIGGGNQNTIGFPAIYSTIGGGDNNNIADALSVIGGGDNNNIAAQSYNATIAGGHYNSMGVNCRNSTIGGGSGNIMLHDAQFATISGGSENRIRTNGHFAMIPGGRLNSATNYAFAAGLRAKANHTGAFVWADSTEADFASTAPNQFLIRASGGVGLGTTNPQAALHVYSANTPTTIRVQSAAQPGAGRVEFLSDPQGSGSEWRPGYIQSTDNGGFTGGLSFVVNGTGFGNRFAEVETMRVVNGRVGIGTNNPQSALQVIGTVTATAFNPPSDRNLKENFAPVSPRDVLEKVSGLPISRWNFKGDAATPHVGPMAQDFHAAFGLGTDERHIATVDADGVALAAIQGLNQKLEAEVKSKDSRINELEKRLSAIEALLQK